MQFLQPSVRSLGFTVTPGALPLQCVLIYIFVHVGHSAQYVFISFDYRIIIKKKEKLSKKKH